MKPLRCSPVRRLAMLIAGLTGCFAVACPAGDKPTIETTSNAKPIKSEVKDSVKSGKISAPPSVARQSARDPLSAIEEIDRLVSKQLLEAGISPSPQCEDGEFVRRVTVDILGRIPTYEESIAFMECNDSAKRQTLIDGLLDRSSYGEHFATIWNELIVPRDMGLAKSATSNPLADWLAVQFNHNRGWNEIVAEMLTVEGNLCEKPQSGFIMANSENLEPKANLVTDATARLFWGVQLRCAECHDHPFARWKQGDFWGTAAFFSRLRKGLTAGKNPAGWTLTEAEPDQMERLHFDSSMIPNRVPGPAIIIPSAAGKQSGAIVKARFLGGEEADWEDDGPFRKRFSDWATGRDNPFFARNAVNRMWSHFFGRGFVNPLDEFRDDNPASHPELLDRLASEFVESDFDLRYLIRCICGSETYQRTSRPESGNEIDTVLFSHQAVRVMRPHVLYNSLSVALNPPIAKPGAKGSLFVDRVNPMPDVPRHEFIRFFSSVVDENQGSSVNLAIPQFLRLMNSSLVDAPPPLIDRLSSSNLTTTQIIDRLFVAAYSRLPREAEMDPVTNYIASSADRKAATTGLVWVLLNSSEFVLNH